jgi:Ser/Thr protein kinase RdoA (MazF antagonist)
VAQRCDQQPFADREYRNVSVATVHSMGATDALADWPRLDTKEVNTVLERWGLADANARVIWHSPRPLSSAAIVALTGRKVFIKRHNRAVRTAPELQEEHRFIQHLHAHGAPVSGVIQATDAITAVERGGWTYEIHELGAGVDLYRDAVSWSPFVSTDHAIAAGHALALLHVSARGFDAPPRSAPLLVSNDAIIRSTEPLQVIQHLIDRRPALEQYFRGKHWQVEIARAIAPFHDRFLDTLPHLDSLWTHSDWHASNLLWSDTGATATVRTVLDFGLSDRTSAVYDLATAIERNTIPWLQIHDGVAASADLELVSGLVRGYLRGRPLSSWERAALIAILPLVHVGYAVTEIDYFHGITHSAENADLAYFGFLIGHCGWFETVHGRALLDHVHRELQALP